MSSQEKKVVTIEAIDLAGYDWQPACEIEFVFRADRNKPFLNKHGEPCDKPAAFVVEIRHCTPYRLFCCTHCARDNVDWICRSCGVTSPSPILIGSTT